MFSILDRLKTISRITMISPEPTAGRFGVAIAAIVKNEGLYIREWIRFHYLAGVRHFYIYDNGSTDNTCEILKEVLPDNVITVVPWRQCVGPIFPKETVIHNQVLAYAHAASNFGGEYRWMAFIDIDEFLVPKVHNNICQALMSLSTQDNISLPWHMFGTSGHKKKPGGEVLESYLLRYKPLNENDKGMMNYKCLVDPCKLTGLRVHSMQTAGKWITSNDKGERALTKNRNKKGFYSSDLIQLNHYYTRSEEEFLNKAEKGHVLNKRSNRYKQKLLGAMIKIDSNVVEDLTAIQFLRRVNGATK